jgi:biotin synthase-related radical SAM superfamily protein
LKPDLKAELRPDQQLITELQSLGLRLTDPSEGAASRRGGAGPSDHKAVNVNGHTVMIPVHTASSWSSPYVATPLDASGNSMVTRNGFPVGVISFPKQPRFYKMQTMEGVPYSHIATLHGSDVLATTIFQCEPPNDDMWFQRMKDAGIDALGMHLEAVTPEVRARIMPGKAEVPVERYFDAFEKAVAVFGAGQVSTYILAGLGDTQEAILRTCEKLIAIGVYPFVVPFVPIAGTPLEDHPSPSSDYMRELLSPLGAMLGEGGLRSSDIKAGCGRCGACSSLSTFERKAS